MAGGAGDHEVTLPFAPLPVWAFPPSCSNAVDQLATLPGIRRRTAMRMALDLLRRDVPGCKKRFAEGGAEAA